MRGRITLDYYRSGRQSLVGSFYGRDELLTQKKVTLSDLL